MAAKRYLDVRFDVTDLSEDERACLAGEVAAQADRSKGDGFEGGAVGHPSVEYEIEWNDVDDDESPELVGGGDLTPAARAAVEALLDAPAACDHAPIREAVESAATLWRALVAADDTTRTNDTYEEFLAEETRRVVERREPYGLVGNVLLRHTAAAMLRDYFVEVERGRVEQGSIWFDPYLALYEPHDEGDEPLFLMYGAADGEGGTVFAPWTSDVGELERRLTRFFGDGAFILDDHDEAVPPSLVGVPRPVPQANLVHASQSCDDPDCEIHHPEVIEDEAERYTAMAYYEAGYRAAARGLVGESLGSGLAPSEQE